MVCDKNREAHGTKCRFGAMICTMLIQAIYICFYTYWHLKNPEVMIDEKARPHCCVTQERMAVVFDTEAEYGKY